MNPQEINPASKKRSRQGPNLFRVETSSTLYFLQLTRNSTRTMFRVVKTAKRTKTEKAETNAKLKARRKTFETGEKPILRTPRFVAIKKRPEPLFSISCAPFLISPCSD